MLSDRSRRLRVEPLEDRRLLSVAAMDIPFAIHLQSDSSQTTYGQSRAAAVAACSSGDFVAVWSNETGDDGYDVFGRRFDSAGAAVGEKFLVNQATSGEQKFTGVAMDADGDFVVTWSSLWQDGSLYGTYARRFDASGTPQGSEFRVNETVEGNQDFSAVAMDADGDFTVVWTSSDQDGDGTGIVARRYDADGAAASDEIMVNTTTTGNQRHPALGSDGTGGTVVAWTSDRQDGSSGGIFAQRLASDGTLVGDEFQVNTTVDGNQQLPTVAVAPGGTFVIAWQSFDLSDGQWKVMAQTYGADGNPLGEETLVGDGRHAAVAIGELGDFLVAWESPALAEDGSKDIRIQHFTPTGLPDGSVHGLEAAGGSLTAPSIAMQNGVAVVQWTTNTDGMDTSTVQAQRLQVTIDGTFNQPPVLALPDDLAVDENETVSLTISATDPDGPEEELVYSFAGNGPAGATLDPETGQFLWTPEEAHGGRTFQIDIRVTDSGTPALSDQGAFTITVGEQNQAPVLDAVDDVTAEEGEALSIPFTATDPDQPGQSLSYSLDAGAPDGASIDSATGVLSWTPGESHGGGQYPITVTVSDDGTPVLTDSISLTITVNETNSAPRFDDPGVQTIDLGETLSLDLNATDEDDPPNTLTFSLDSGGPEGVALDPATGQLTWTPTTAQGPGDYDIPVRVTDDGDPSLDATFVLQVSVEVTMLEPLPDHTIEEEIQLTLQPVLTPPYDQASGLMFALEPGAPAGAAIDGSTGQLTWTPNEQQGPGEYPITVRVTDDANPVYTDTESFTVTVLEANAAPALPALPDVTIPAGAPFYLPLRGTDSDGDSLVYGISTTEAQLAASVSETNRSLRLDIQSYGVLEFELFEDRAPNTTGRIAQLVDSGFYDGLLLHRVADLGDGTPFVIQGGDPNGNGTGGSGQTFDDEYHPELMHTASGVLSMANSGNDTNDSQFFVTGQATRFLDFKHAVFGYQTSGEDVRQAIEAVQRNASDRPLADVVIQSAEIFVDPQTGLLVLSAPDGFLGEADVTVTVTDADGVTDTQTFHVTIVEDTDPSANSPPYLEAIDDIEMLAGQVVDVTLPAIDIENDPVFFSAEVVGGSEDLLVTVDEATGEVTITASAAADGNYTVRFAVGAASGEQHDSQLVPVLVQPVSVQPDNTPPTIGGLADHTVIEGETVQFTATATDPDLPAQTLTFSLDAGAPEGTTIDPVSGVFSWTPTEADGPGAYSITVRVTDDGNEPLSATGSFTITVEETNTAPIFEDLPDQNLNEGATVQFTATATDTDLPAQTLTYSLDTGAPTGASIDPVSGAFSWQTSEADAPGTYSITVRVTDDGQSPLSDTESFTVTILVVNTPPVLAPIGDQTINEGATVQFTATATDSDLPAQTLTYSLDAGAPADASIDPVSGAFSWQTSEADAPGTYSITIRVTDDGPDALSDTESFTVTILEVNTPPVLAPIGNQTVNEGATVQFTASATDTDLPAQTLTYSLDTGAPDGASIDPVSGAFSWQTTEADAPGTYSITVRVTDDGPGALSDTESFTVTIVEVNTPPVLADIGDQTVNEGSVVQFTATATDSDLPAQTLTYSLDAGAPTGASIDPVSGAFSWQTTEADAPGTYTITVRVTDDGPDALSDSESFTVTILEVNTPPVLAPIGDQTVNEGATVQFTASATDTDLPAQTLTYALDVAPAGATIDGSTGELLWVTTEADGPGSYAITVCVTDDGTPNRSDTETFSVTVRETQSAPVIDPIPNQTVTEGDTVQFIAAATDPDGPSQSLTFSLAAGAPAGAAIDPVTGQFIWQTSEENGPGLYAVTVRATDNGSTPLTASRSLMITVNESNRAPQLAPIADLSIEKGETVQFTASATDGDIPAQSLAWRLLAGAPSAAWIDAATGRFTWPTSVSEPGSYPITVQVTDSGSPALSATESFVVTIAPSNSAPVLAAIGNRTVTEGETLRFTVIATDSDAPAQTLRYSLEPGAPDGASIDPLTGEFQWATTAADGPETYSITVRVRDDGSPALGDQETFTAIVEGSNDPTVLSPIADQSAVQGRLFTTVAEATDVDGTVAFRLASGAPAGATIDPATGQITWTPSLQQPPGVYRFTVVAADDGPDSQEVSTSFEVRLFATDASGAIVWGPVEQDTIPSMAVQDGTAFTLTPIRNGQLAVEARFDPAEGGLQFELHNASGGLVASSRSVPVGQRLDATVQAGASYRLVVSGQNPDVVFAVSNLLRFSDGTAYVYGTSGDDAIAVSAGAEHVVVVNGMSHTVPSTTYGTVEIDTGTGEDTFTLTGDGSDESVTLRPGFMELTGTDHRIVAFGFAAGSADGGGGVDVARFYGSEGNDHLTVGPYWGRMTGKGFTLEVSAFRDIHGIADPNDRDTTEMLDSADNDTFIGKPEYSRLYSDNFLLRTKWFTVVTARATAGGYDTASLIDSDYDDVFAASPYRASMTGSGIDLIAEGFESALGYARSGGHDVAKLTDSPGDDTFKATPEYAKMMGDGYFLRAKFFEQMMGYATGGGVDLARFYDSDGDDTYNAAPDYAWMAGDGYFLRGKFFEHYRGHATGAGNDVATLHDSALDDLLRAEGNEAHLSTAEQADLHAVIAFDLVTAESSHDDDNDETEIAATLDFLLTLEGSW